MMGLKAVEVLKSGSRNRVIAVKNSVVIDLDLEEALAMKKELPEELIALSKILSL